MKSHNKCHSTSCFVIQWELCQRGNINEPLSNAAGFNLFCSCDAIKVDAFLCSWAEKRRSERSDIFIQVVMVTISHDGYLQIVSSRWTRWWRSESFHDDPLEYFWSLRWNSEPLLFRQYGLILKGKNAQTKVTVPSVAAAFADDDDEEKVRDSFIGVWVTLASLWTSL